MKNPSSFSGANRNRCRRQAGILNSALQAPFETAASTPSSLPASARNGVASAASAAAVAFPCPTAIGAGPPHFILATDAAAHRSALLLPLTVSLQQSSGHVTSAPASTRPHAAAAPVLSGAAGASSPPSFPAAAANIQLSAVVSGVKVAESPATAAVAAAISSTTVQLRRSRRLSASWAAQLRKSRSCFSTFVAAAFLLLFHFAQETVADHHQKVDQDAFERAPDLAAALEEAAVLEGALEGQAPPPPLVRWRQTPAAIRLFIHGSFSVPKIRFRDKGFSLEGYARIEEDGQKKKFALDINLLRLIDPKTSSFTVKSRVLEVHMPKKKEEPCWRTLGPIHEVPPPYLKREFNSHDSEMCFMAKVVWRGKYFWERKFRVNRGNSPAEEFYEDYRPTGVNPAVWNKIIRDIRRRAIDPGKAEEEDASLQAEIAVADKLKNTAARPRKTERQR